MSDSDGAVAENALAEIADVDEAVLAHMLCMELSLVASGASETVVAANWPVAMSQRRFVCSLKLCTVSAELGGSPEH